MPKIRRRKIPITHEPVQASSSKPSSSRAVIRQYHLLLKAQAQLNDQDPEEAPTHGVPRTQEMRSGLGQYQRMSAIGQGNDRGGGSERVLILWLKDLRVGVESSTKKTLLEVGALRPDNYKSCSSWITPTAIDLQSHHPSILEQDFMLMELKDHRSTWDIVSLSLVLNFVPDPKGRGDMLRHAAAMLAPQGFLFLVLPLPCVSNSRYLTPEHLEELMGVLGLKQIRSRWKDGGKMAYWLYQRHDDPQPPGKQFRKKKVLRQGNRNNFCICLS